MCLRTSLLLHEGYTELSKFRSLLHYFIPTTCLILGFATNNPVDGYHLESQCSNGLGMENKETFAPNQTSSDSITNYSCCMAVNHTGMCPVPTTKHQEVVICNTP